MPNSVKDVALKAKCQEMWQKLQSTAPKTVSKTSMVSVEAIVCIKCTFMLIGMFSNPISATLVLIAGLAVTAAFITFTVKALNLFIPNPKKPSADFLTSEQPLPTNTLRSPTPLPPVATHLPEPPAPVESTLTQSSRVPEPKVVKESVTVSSVASPPEAASAGTPPPNVPVAHVPPALPETPIAELQPRNPIAGIPEECLPYYLELPEMTAERTDFILEFTRTCGTQDQKQLNSLRTNQKALESQAKELLDDAHWHPLQSLDFLLSTPENIEVLSQAVNTPRKVLGVRSAQAIFLNGQLLGWNQIVKSASGNASLGEDNTSEDSDESTEGYSNQVADKFTFEQLQKILPGFAHSSNIPVTELNCLIDKHFKQPEKPQKSCKKTSTSQPPSKRVFKTKLKLSDIVAFANDLIAIKKMPKYSTTPTKFPQAAIQAFVQAKEEGKTAAPVITPEPATSVATPAELPSTTPKPEIAETSLLPPAPAILTITTLPEPAAPENLPPPPPSSPSSDATPSLPPVERPVQTIEKVEPSVSVIWTVDMIRALSKKTRQDIANFLDKKHEHPKEGKKWSEPRGSAFHEDHVTFRAALVVNLLNNKYKDQYKFENGNFTEIKAL